MRIKDLWNFDFALALGFALLLCAGLLKVGAWPNVQHTSFKLALLVFFILVGVECFLRERSLKRSATNWLPLLLAIWIYGNLKDLLIYFQGEPITSFLMSFDQKLLQPTVAISQFYHPVLTWVLAPIYMDFLIVPLFMLLVFSLKDKQTEFGILRRAMILVFLAGFIGYFVFPATLPRFILSYDSQIPGFGFSSLQDFWDVTSAEARLGAFPSLHVAMAALCSLHVQSFDYSKQIKALLQLNLFLMSVATIYFRQHWTLDLVAGALLAAVVYLIVSLPAKRASLEEGGR